MIKNELQIKKFVTGSFQENAYLLWKDGGCDAVLIDPGADPEVMLSELKQQRLQLRAILNTHGHVDHVGAVYDIKLETKVKFYLHENDKSIVQDLPRYCQMFGLPTSQPPEIDEYLFDNQKLNFGLLEFEVIATPGHTLGGVCFRIENHLFVGDTLFYGSIGRTDLPGGNYNQIIESIKTRLLVLGDDIKVHTGHGPDTTIRQERLSNSFLA